MTSFEDVHGIEQQTDDKSDAIITEEVDTFLESLDNYDRGDPIGYYSDKPGYIGTYLSCDGLYYTYIHFTSNTVRVYKEYECGGKVDSFSMDIIEDDIENTNAFKSLMEQVFERVFKTDNSVKPKPNIN